MTKAVDLVVIGSGAAASTVAQRCRAQGWSVVLADARPFGGTCALRGCDPKKVLVGAAALVDWSRRMKGKGVRSDGARIHWRELMAFKRTFTDPVPAAREKSFREAGIEACPGTASFTGPSTVQVNGSVFESRHVVIAAGARPAALGIPGEHLLATSDDFLELEDLPRRVLFVGGGYIAFEFSHIAARAGAEVTVLHRGKRPLEQFDPGLVEQLVAHSRRIGIRLEVEADVERVEKSAQGLSVEARMPSGIERFEADLVIHAAGRVPNLDNLNLEAAGVERERRGVKVNEFLQSVSNPAVYAAGDAAASGAPLTPVASQHGSIVAENLLHGNCRTTSYTGMASVVYSIPPLASAGLQEQDATEQGYRFDTHFQPDTSSWYSSRRIAEECAGYKMLVEKDSGKILGAHLLGEGADELINVLALAIHAGLPGRQLIETLFAYPTHGSNLVYML